MSNSIGILREPELESRVCLIPDAVRQIKERLGYKVYVEEGAGVRAGFEDRMYAQSGAEVVSKDEVYDQSNRLLSINHLYCGRELKGEKSFIGVYNFLFHNQRISAYYNDKLSVYSLDLIPRITKAQSMDVLSSMASLSGYKAVIKAAELYSSVLPMFTTAAGTLRPAKVLVLGAGVAGLQAIATAKRLGAQVEAFDVRRIAGEEVRSLGAKFIEVPGFEDAEAGDGYAAEQSEAYTQRVRELLHQHIQDASIIITTANIPGKKAPVMVKKESVAAMQPGSVIVDLASEQGGNCELTLNEEMREYNGVRIIGNSMLAREMSTASSKMLSSNYLAFLKHLDQVNGSEAEDPILAGCKVLDKGSLVHPKFKEENVLA